MTRHVFGGIWCASSTAYALRHTIKGENLDSLVTDTILKAFYADDCLRSVSSREDVHKTIMETKNFLATKGFNLTKFLSNTDYCSEVETVSKDISDIHSSTRVLGVLWDPKSDEFHFEVNAKHQVDCKVTRRTMLSFSASMYDPLGLLSPITVIGKMLFQDATRLKLNWDENILADMSRRWREWLASLADLSLVRIQRCLLPTQFSDSYLELHHFSDASQHAYGCCTYLRVVHKNGSVLTALVFSKSRLAPIKPITLPRLELQAALLAVQVDL